MKNIKTYLFVLFASLAMTSCLVDDDPIVSDLNDDGINFVGFDRNSLNISVITDGDDKEFTLPVRLAGPTASSYNGEFTANIEVDPSSTAIEGVHYRLNSNIVTISSENNLIENLPLTIITEGIDPPLATNPKLILNITNLSDGSVLLNGRTSSITINIEYLCFSDITGKYRALEAKYFRLGVESGLSNPASWPAETEIIFLCGTTFRVLDWFGPFGPPGNPNEWYFDVNETTGEITYPATTPTGEPQLGNGQPFISCQTNPGDFTSVGISCGSDSNRVDVVNGNIRLTMSYGYNTTGSGPRVFYHVLEKINN